MGYPTLILFRLSPVASISRRLASKPNNPGSHRLELPSYSSVALMPGRKRTLEKQFTVHGGGGGAPHFQLINAYSFVGGGFDPFVKKFANFMESSRDEDRRTAYIAVKRGSSC